MNIWFLSEAKLPLVITSPLDNYECEAFRIIMSKHTVPEAFCFISCIFMTFSLQGVKMSPIM